MPHVRNRPEAGAQAQNGGARDTVREAQGHRPPEGHGQVLDALEGDRRAIARSENICIEYAASTDLALMLKNGRDGKDSGNWDILKDSDQTFFRLVILRFSRPIQKERQNIDAVIESNSSGEMVAATSQAMNTVTAFGANAAQLDPKLNGAKMCFCVTAGGSTETIRLIFCPARNDALLEAFRVLQKTQVIESMVSESVMTLRSHRKPRKMYREGLAFGRCH